MNDRERIDGMFGIFKTIMPEQPRGQLIDFEAAKTRMLAKKMIDDTPPRTPNPNAPKAA